MSGTTTTASRHKHPLLKHEDGRLCIITVAELFDTPDKPAVRLDLPVARADAGRQAALDL